MIYGLATLTIAGGAGDHADYGLPGISVPRKAMQYSERVNGIQLATMSLISSVVDSGTLFMQLHGPVQQRLALDPDVTQVLCMASHLVLF